MPRPLTWFMVGMAFVVLTASAIAYVWQGEPDAVGVAVLAALAWWIQREGRSGAHRLYASPLAAVLVSAAALVGPAGAVSVALLAGVYPILHPPRGSSTASARYGAVFNMLMYGLITMAAALAYAGTQHLLGGHLGVVPSMLVGLVAAAVAHDVGNLLVVGVPLSLTGPLGYLPAVRLAGATLAQWLPTNLASAALLTLLWGPSGLGPVSVVLFALPVAVRLWRLRQLLAEEAEQDRALESFGLAAEVSDADGHGSVERVWATCRAILGQRSDISAGLLEPLRMACAMRDVGLTAAHRAMGERVDEVELRRIVRQHPEASVDVIRDLDFLDDARAIILAHHERWDGLGYPRGLRREEIPMGARVLSVAEGFCALTTGRHPLTTEDALTVLERQSGLAYSGNIVSALRRACENGFTAPPGDPAHADSLLVQHTHPDFSDLVAGQPYQNGETHGLG